MNFSALTYLFPKAFFLNVALFLILTLFFSLFYHRKKIAEQWGYERPALLFWGKSSLFCLAWFFLTLALTQPINLSMGPEKSTLTRQIEEVTFLIDTSASMSTADTRRNKTRLEYAKEIADLIAGELSGDKVSLYTFTSEPNKIVPETFNTPFLRFMLEQLQIDEGGTDLKNVLEKVLQKKKTLLIFSDGGDAVQTDEIASLAKGANVFTIGLGAKETSPIPNLKYRDAPVLSKENEKLLQQIAKEGQGRYYFANQMTPLEIAQDIKRVLDKQPSETTTSGQEWVEKPYFFYPLALAILCLTLYLYLPDTLKKISLFLCITPMLWGGEFKEAAIYYEAKEYAKAQNNYEIVLQQPLTAWQRAVVLYNLATTDLAANELESGRVLLQTVPSYPILEKDLSRNKAIAFFRLAKKERSAELLQAALNEIEQAELEGNDMRELRNTAKVLLAQHLEKDPSYLLSDILFNVRFLLEKGPQKNYQKYTEEQIRQLMPLFKDPALAEESLTFLQKENFEKTLERLLEIKKELDVNPTLFAYQRALSQKILFKGLIEELLSLQKNPNLTKSLQALEENNPKLARLYLLEARQDLMREEWRKEKTTALQTLEQAIEEQKHVVALSRNEAPLSFVSKAQKNALLKAKPFLSLLFSEQSKKGVCQKEPWDEALPLFHKGFEKAQLPTLSDQTSALFDWFAAYNLIKDYKPKKVSRNTELNKVLNNLQLMREDRVQKQKQLLTPKEERPW